MSRSICYCDPNFLTAGENSTLKFVYVTSNEIPAGTKLKFDIHSLGRPTDWEIPQTNLNKKKNLIFAKHPNGKILKATKVKNAISQFEFTIPSKIPISKEFTIILGSSKNIKKNGTRTQTFIQRKRKFTLYIGDKKNGYKEKEIFQIDVRGNIFTKLNILVPSLVSRNRRFEVILRFEDQFGNLTGNASEDTLIELKYQNLRENLNWKLFIPETGFLSIPNLYFNEPGTYHLQFTNLKTKQFYISSPIKCIPNSDLSIFWGSFHSESEKVDGSVNIENCLRHFRDEKGFQFYASSPFDSAEETTNELWKNISQSIHEINEDLRFSLFLGFQWVGSLKEEGVRQLVYLKDHKQLLRKKDLKFNSLKKIYKSLTSKELISIPSFTMSNKTGFNFKEYNQEFERVVEIYNSWGCSECLAKDGNRAPIKGSLAQEDKEGSIQKALYNNCRVGFVAGGLDDRGIYQGFFDSNQKQYSPGLTAIISQNHSKESLFNSLKKRFCYATTGVKIVLNFSIANSPMGSELNTIQKPGLQFNRYISSFIVGTDVIEKVEIIRNNKIFKTFYPKTNDFDFTLNDEDNLSQISIKTKDHKLFTYYYLRVIQKDGHIAWGSPIWIDFLTDLNKKSRAKLK
ncbi:MAG: hypothetical protein AMS24_01435 [Chlamydiae bacterium SM23_39]|nr:MAG: hypothetical protein AMS24_01435 [Chlamydiae bacterium SM23_39]